MKNAVIALVLFFCCKNASSQEISVGKFYQGGIVFYVDSTNHFGLIAAPNDLNPEIPPKQAFPLCIFPLFDKPIITDTTIGSGRQNCLNILNANPNLVLGVVTPVNSTTPTNLNSSVKICDTTTINGYDDWYLPSRNELRLMWFLRDVIGNFNTNINGATVYGSSSQVAGGLGTSNNSVSWDVQFNYDPTNVLSPFLRPDVAGYTIIVRPVRTFYFPKTTTSNCAATICVPVVTTKIRVK